LSRLLDFPKIFLPLRQSSSGFLSPSRFSTFFCFLLYVRPLNFFRVFSISSIRLRLSLFFWFSLRSFTFSGFWRRIPPLNFPFPEKLFFQVQHFFLLSRTFLPLRSSLELTLLPPSALADCPSRKPAPSTLRFYLRRFPQVRSFSLEFFLLKSFPSASSSLGKMLPPDFLQPSFSLTDPLPPPPMFSEASPPCRSVRLSRFLRVFFSVGTFFPDRSPPPAKSFDYPFFCQMFLLSLVFRPFFYRLFHAPETPTSS